MLAYQDEIQAKHSAIALLLRHADIDLVVVTEADFENKSNQLNSRELIQGVRTSMSDALDTELRRDIAGTCPTTFGALIELVGAEYAIAALARGMTFFNTQSRLTASTALEPLQEHFDAAHVILGKSTHSPIRTELHSPKIKR